LLINCQAINIAPTPLENIATASIEDISSAIVTTMEHLGFGSIISDDAILSDAEVLEGLQSLSPEMLINFIDYFTQQNALLGESNPAAAAALGCNFNAQALISTESSMNAIFYLIEYVTKDSMKPAELLSFIRAARTRYQQYSGHAPDGADPQANDRPSRRLAQIVQNGIAGAVEVAAQQCALNVANLPSHDCSESFSFVFPTPAIRECHKAWHRFQGNIDGDDVDLAVDRGLGLRLGIRQGGGVRLSSMNIPSEPIPEPQGSHLYDPYYPQYAAMDSVGNDNVQVAVGTMHRNTHGELAVISQDIDYAHRGANLSFLSLTEYACCVRRERKTRQTNVTSNPPTSNFEAVPNNTSDPTSDPTEDIQQIGRRSNSVFQFDSPYPLTDIFHQKIASLQTVPIFGGLSSVPNWPDFDVNTIDYNQLMTQQTAFAEWVLAVLIPWPAPGFQYFDMQDDPVDRFDKILLQLQAGTFLQQPDGSYIGPPGYGFICLEARTEKSKAYAFSQIALARFIGNLARGLKRTSKESRCLQAVWRGRGAQHWDCVDPEQRLFPEDYARANAIPRRDGHGSTGNDVDEVIAPSHEDIVAFTIDLLRQATRIDVTHDLESGTEHSRLTTFLQDIANCHGIIRGVVHSTVGNQLSQLSHDQDVFPPLGGIHIEANDIAALNIQLQEDPTVITIAEQSTLPPLASENNTHHVLGRASLAVIQMATRVPPAKKPNDGQLLILQELAEYFDNVVAGRECIPPLLFIDGAGGTGKSFIFSCIEELADAVGRTIAPSALSGVACTAIPTRTGVRTTASLFKLGISPANIRPLRDAQRISICDFLRNPIAIIIDEISFAAASVLAAVHMRLQEVSSVANTNLPFGGIAIILSGDFFQLPPVGCNSLYQHAMNGSHLYQNTGPNGMNALGTELFLRFRRCQLTEQVRCLDPIHAGFCARFRQGNTDGLRDYIARHLLRAQDSAEFNSAPILSPGNPERYHMEHILLSEFAANRRDRVVSWKLPASFVGSNIPLASAITSMANVQAAEIAENLNPQLMSHFCAGAPVILSNNINPLRGLANGVKAKLYALIWPNPIIRAAAIQYLDSNSGNVFLPEGLEPSTILVRPTLNLAFSEAWPESLTAICNDIIVPVDIKREKIKLTTGDCTIQAVVERPQYDLGFISTIYKSQGLTLFKVILSFLDRPGKPSRKCFHSVYVALTRMQTGDDFRVLGHINDLYFLEDLKTPIPLLAFLDGYNDHGVWEFDRAQAALTIHLNAQRSTQNNNRRGGRSSRSHVSARGVSARGISARGEHSSRSHVSALGVSARGGRGSRTRVSARGVSARGRRSSRTRVSARGVSTRGGRSSRTRVTACGVSTRGGHISETNTSTQFRNHINDQQIQTTIRPLLTWGNPIEETYSWLYIAIIRAALNMDPEDQHYAARLATQMGYNFTNWVVAYRTDFARLQFTSENLLYTWGNWHITNQQQEELLVPANLPTQLGESVGRSMVHHEIYGDMQMFGLQAHLQALQGTLPDITTIN
jgi:hypothetical protein